MKPEEQLIAIAKVCGWTQRQTFEIDGVSFPYWHHNDDSKYVKGNLPDYLTDLNAMHEAEKVLDARQCDVYHDWLAQNIQPLDYTIEADGWSWHATAAQRAEAFLRTLALWRKEA